MLHRFSVLVCLLLLLLLTSAALSKPLRTTTNLVVPPPRRRRRRRALVDTPRNHPENVVLTLPRGGGGRGGGAVGARVSNKHNNHKQPTPTGRRQPPSQCTAAGIAAALVAGSLLVIHRDRWVLLVNKERIQEAALHKLHQLNAFSKPRSYTTYAVGMAVWEFLGLSTIPVETAAGMVFGWDALWLSAAGKVLGAGAAFGLGRRSVWIQQRLLLLQKNPFLQLIQANAAAHPWRVALLLKCSCVPETMKNFGSAMIAPITWSMFVVGTVTHGWLFTALWTYLGVDTAMRLEDHESLLPADRKLQILLTLALINGVIVSPLAMAYWVRSLREHGNKQKK